MINQIEEYCKEVKEILEKNRPLMEALMEALKEKDYLLCSEISRIVESVKG